MSKERYQVFQIAPSLYATGVQQQRFWRRVHRYLLEHRTWWRREPDGISIDLVYRANESVITYLTLPNHVVEHVPQYLGKKERKNKGNWNFPVEEPRVLGNYKASSVCELKLSFDSIFSLPSQEVQLPAQLGLQETETARIQFSLMPVKKKMVNSKSTELVRGKMNNGFKPYRGFASDTQFIKFFVLWLRQLFGDRKQGKQGETYLSKETIRKLNDVHFDVAIRIAADQRVLPKLAAPFVKLKGENELKIQFLSRNKQVRILKGMTKNKIATGPQPNRLSVREISYLFPFLSTQNQTNNEDLRSSL